MAENSSSSLKENFAKGKIHTNNPDLAKAIAEKQAEATIHRANQALRKHLVEERQRGS